MTVADKTYMVPKLGKANGQIRLSSRDTHLERCCLCQEDGFAWIDDGHGFSQRDHFVHDCVTSFVPLLRHRLGACSRRSRPPKAPLVGRKTGTSMACAMVPVGV